MKVRIALGDLLQFRERGRRQWYDLAIDDAFGVAVRCGAGFRHCYAAGPKLQRKKT